MAIPRKFPLPEALSGQRPVVLVVLAVGACLAAVTGLLLTGGATITWLLPLSMIGIVLLAVWSPYWALVLTLAQYAVLPHEGQFFGYFVPNLLQVLAPLVLVVALLQALKNADHERLTLRLHDFFAGGFVLWGLVGLFAVAGGAYWKWYGNRMALPLLLYFAVHLIPFKYRDIRRLVLILLVVTTLQSILMFRESMAGSSPLYQVEEGLMRGVKPAKGPFPFKWNAAAYLALWPSLFIYAIASTNDRRKKLLWGLGLLVVLAASTRTMARAGLAASLLAIAFCLFSARMRRTALAVLGILVIAYVPWSLGRPGAALIGRFQETDQSRYAYRTAAINLLRSPSWDPIFGVGWAMFRQEGGRHGTEEQIVAWGTKPGTVREIAQGSRLHNVWLAIPVEFGGGGVLLFIGILLGLLRGLRRVWRGPPKDREVDDALVVSLLGSLVAVAAIGYYQNIYMMPEVLCVIWVFYSLLTNHPQAFAALKGDKANSKEKAGAN